MKNAREMYDLIRKNGEEKRNQDKARKEGQFAAIEKQLAESAANLGIKVRLLTDTDATEAEGLAVELRRLGYRAHPWRQRSPGEGNGNYYLYIDVPSPTGHR